MEVIYMIKCSEKCIPCCDYCIHCIHELFEWEGKIVNGAPIGCSKHLDDIHQKKAEGCGYCEDFHCCNAK